MMSHVEDEDNPPVGRTFFGRAVSPGLTQQGISMGASFALTHMLVHGLTGRGRLALLMATFTIPFSSFISVLSDTADYGKWVEMQALRQKGVPDRFLPYKCRFDWTDHHKRNLERKAKEAE